MRTLNKYLNGLCLWEECANTRALNVLPLVCRQHTHLFDEVLNHLELTYKQCDGMIKRLCKYYYEIYNIDKGDPGDPQIPIGNHTWSYMDYVSNRCDEDEITYFTVEYLDMEITVYMKDPLLVVKFPNRVIYDTPSVTIYVPTMKHFLDSQAKYMDLDSFPEDLAVLKKAYHKRALETHPDKGGDPTEFQKMVNAYELLQKPRQDIEVPKTVYHKHRFFFGKDMSIMMGNNREWMDLIDIIIPMGNTFEEWTMATGLLFSLHRELECVQNIKNISP